jgi:uncharacterized damage-inducible protein DinB
LHSLVEHFRDMARNNAWSNHRLYSACAKLSPADIVAPRTSFFPSIDLTLRHNLDVDQFYIAMLDGGEKPPLPASDIGVPALHTAQTESDRRLITFCDALTPEGLDRETRLVRRTGVKVDSAGAILIHLFVHQIHHRGQAHAMLSDTPVPPPQLDEFFLAEDADHRRQGLIELGLEID